MLDGLGRIHPPRGIYHEQAENKVLRVIRSTEVGSDAHGVVLYQAVHLRLRTVTKRLIAHDFSEDAPKDPHFALLVVLFGLPKNFRWDIHASSNGINVVVVVGVVV
jgi:hypothetical protein